MANSFNEQDPTTIVKDDEPLTTSGPPHPRTYCSVPDQVCYSTPELGAARRQSFSERCADAWRYYNLGEQIRGLGADDYKNCASRMQVHPDPLTNGGVITSANTQKYLFQYGPCNLAKVPDCAGGGGTVSAQQEEGSSEEEAKDGAAVAEDDNKKYMVGGLLALLVVGGLVYAATKKKKKKGGRK